MARMIPQSAYIHIPFCRRRCFYCDFPVAVVGDKPPVGNGERINGRNSGTIAQYVEMLCQEIRQTIAAEQPLKTVFFGGGTPSLLSVEQVNTILTVLNAQLGFAKDVEISMEIDPATFDREQVQGYQAAGVNRVSLGVQAFQPVLLAAAGRSHTVEDIYTAVDYLHQVGFGNISLDLISGLPYQTLAQWEESLQKAIALSPTHISCYDLIVEAGTPFSRQYQPGVKPLPSDEMTAEMYRMAQQILTADGFEHYEISNYAKLGYQCQHNRTYWKNQPFYGFGMGATSYLGGKRIARPRKTWEYYEWVNAEVTRKQGHNESLEATITDDPPEFLETLMLGLRLAEGLSLENLTATFGEAAIEKLWKCLQPYLREGLVAVFPVGPGESFPRQGHLRLTDPEGFLFSNSVLTAIFEEFDTDLNPNL